MTKEEDFEAGTKPRGKELKALAEAKAVIKENVSGASGLSYGLDHVSFVQASMATTTSAHLAHFEAMHLILVLARKMHAPELAQLASGC